MNTTKEPGQSQRETVIEDDLLAELSPKTPTIVLNQGQEEAAEAFFEFLMMDQKEFIISGPGGVGKTLLMGYLIDKIMPRYFEACKLLDIPIQYDNVVMTATTNKAAEALSLSVNRPTSTIHSFLSLKVLDDYETGEQKITRTNAWLPHERKIIFIDECSMIDRDLKAEILAATPNCKIVYVGDHCQLAPVNESLSPIYRQGIPFCQLTQPMRNSNQPELMKLCQQLRDTVETGVFNPIQIVPGVIDLLDDAQMEQELDRVFHNQTQDSRILAYTNKRVIEYNDHIRNIRKLPDEHVTGEFLVNSNAIRLSGGRLSRMLSVEEGIEIVRQDKDTEFLILEDGAKVEFRKSDIRTSLGSHYSNVRLPVDRNHIEELRKYYKKTKQWKMLFRLKDTFPDLRQRDAATVHKSQGSTYESVFIDLGNISTCNIPSQVARMLYVAVSRPRNRIFFYGNLANKYGGLVF